MRGLLRASPIVMREGRNDRPDHVHSARHHQSNDYKFEARAAMKNVTIRRHGKKYQVRGPHRETGERISIGAYATKKEAERAKKEYEHSLYRAC
jgi:hypothetical protein